MPEYIEREAARKAVCERCDFYGIGADECRECNNPADGIPAADVVEVRHGRWLPVDDKMDAFDCSECDAMVSKRMNYCPNCGAVMDGGQDNV